MDTFLTRVPIAHRGLHDSEKPENSLAAYRAAAELGYAIETDIHFTKDGDLAVIHDDNLKRLTGDSRNVRDCTMSELRALKLLGTDEHVPSLSELLETVGGRVPLLIEIKEMHGVKGKRIAHALSEALAGYTGEYAVQSFNPFYARAYKKLHPEIACGVLSFNMTKKSEGNTVKGAVRAWLLADYRLNFLTHPDFLSYAKEGLPRKSVAAFKGIRLAWTVRSPAEEARARQYADNIIFENYLAEK